MLTHIVIFTWIADASEAQVAAFEQALTQLAAELGDLVSMRHGRDSKIREGNGDYALIATCPDKAGWDAYQSHPKHKAFVRDVVTPLQASRLTIQF
jgi:Stress responsive A/B Barrel Domain